jgi:hypothetical protein
MHHKLGSKSQPSIIVASVTPIAHKLPGILRLSCELRDILYKYYVQNEDGYLYRFETNKLTKADRTAVDLSLPFTCRQIAEEMREVALRANKISFTTFFSEGTRESACLFNATVEWIL